MQIAVEHVILTLVKYYRKTQKSRKQLNQQEDVSSLARGGRQVVSS